MIIEQINNYLVSELNKPIDNYNDYTFNYSQGYNKAMRNVLIFLKQLKEVGNSND